MKTYKGDITVYESDAAEWQKKLADCKKITGSLDASEGASLDLPKLESVGGSLDLGQNHKLEKSLWSGHKDHEWYVSLESSDWLIQQALKSRKVKYRIGSINFERDLFLLILSGDMEPKEVFGIRNMEQRRIAYERMDKSKMQGFGTVVSRGKDNGGKLEIIEAQVDGYEEPFRYLHCFCPSTGREYFLETKQKTPAAAKAASFGLDKVVFGEEW